MADQGEPAVVEIRLMGERTDVHALVVALRLAGLTITEESRPYPSRSGRRVLQYIKVAISRVG